jgi:hypothetical protein
MQSGEAMIGLREFVLLLNVNRQSVNIATS